MRSGSKAIAVLLILVLAGGFYYLYSSGSLSGLLPVPGSGLSGGSGAAPFHIKTVDFSVPLVWVYGCPGMIGCLPQLLVAIENTGSSPLTSVTATVNGLDMETAATSIMPNRTGTVGVTLVWYDKPTQLSHTFYPEMNSVNDIKLIISYHNGASYTYTTKLQFPTGVGSFTFSNVSFTHYLFPEDYYLNFTLNNNGTKPIVNLETDSGSGGLNQYPPSRVVSEDSPLLPGERVNLFFVAYPASLATTVTFNFTVRAYFMDGTSLTEPISNPPSP